jgi:transcriptional regulator with PAS, ATPase and Fis domain
MCKILVIAPYIGLKDVFLEVDKELEVDLDIHVGNLYDGLAIAKSLEHRNYDAIISRGATAKLLQRHFSIPVMEVQVTGYDILRTLTLLNGHSGKIGMMSYLNIIQGADIIGKLLNMDITFYPIDQERQIEKTIETASNDGVQVIIGDVISTTTAATYGVQTILITSGKEAVLETIANTERLVYHMKKQNEHLSEIQRVFDHVEEGVLIFNEDDVCTYLNKHAKKHFQFIEEINTLSLSRLTEIVPKLEQLFEENERALTKEVTVKMQGKNYLWKKVPLIEDEISCGFVLLMNSKDEQELEDRKGHRAFFHFNSLVARSENMHQLIQVAQKISLSNLPLIIYGEPGVGKDSFAQAIHNKSARQQKPYVFVNCEAYSETQLEQVLFGSEGDLIKRGAFELAHEGTLFIDAIGTMPLGLQGKLLNVILSKQFTRLNGTKKIPIDIRFVVAHREPLEAYVQAGRFREDLFYALNGFNLRIPPLRERIDDIDDLVRLFIASSNILTGKQISGLRPELIKELKQLTWPGNIQQLKHVLEQMCIMCEGPFIEKGEVQLLVQKLQEEERVDQVEQTNVLQIHGKTLEEMEQEIIQTVLKQEDFNQSKAAKRLGINRSTLWRKIKHLSV